MRRRNEKFPDNGFEVWGGYMQAKISKLEEQFLAKSGSDDRLSSIFNGVSIYVNGFTIPSADELKVLISKHGGIYHTYRRIEDYIIASNLPDTKVKNMCLSKVVKPEWITDSIVANRLLNYMDYLLFKNSRTQPQLKFTKSIINGKEEKYISNSMTDPHASESVNNDFNKDSYEVKQKLNTDICSHQLQVSKTAADPNFISEFYNNSRLHHISQLGAHFKQHINDLRETSNFDFPARTELINLKRGSNTNNGSQILFENGKTIMHIDMDCFFVSVGLRNKPDLRGKPIAVTHSKGGQMRTNKRPGVDRNTEFNLYKQKNAAKLAKASGVVEESKYESRVDNIGDEDEAYGSMSEIASCSYEARAKGIKNGMFMGQALRLCPDIITIPYDFEGYKEVAFTLYNTIAKYTLDIEAVSCDEMYVDCTNLLKEINMSVQDFAAVIRNKIKSETGCPCSTGFGGNRLQARLATKKAKPDGQFFLSLDLVEGFIFDINLTDLPGVGRQTAQKLESLGHTTCGSLQIMSLQSLKNNLGNKTGIQLFDQCRGRDSHSLVFNTIRKSVSAEVNYGIRFENSEQCYQFLKQLSAEVHSRMLQFKVLGKCVTLKIMVRAEEAPLETAKFMGHGVCDTINKSSTLNVATNDLKIITKEVITLYKKQNIDPREMRGVGIQITKLESIKNNRPKGAINKYMVLKPIKVGDANDTSNKTSPLGKLSDDKLNFEDIKVFEQQPKTHQTPKKIKHGTPKKNSPMKGSKMTSPIIKRRGRPPKLKSLESTSKNLIKLENYQQSYPRKDIAFKNPMLKSEIENRNAKVEEITHKQKGLLGLPWVEVRNLIRAWLDSGQTPLQCDVKLITDYMQNMVMEKDIANVHILVNFLQRRTSEIGSSDWTDVYNNIIEHVQNAMVAFYGKPLYTE